jgi:hypothetical protein
MLTRIAFVVAITLALLSLALPSVDALRVMAVAAGCFAAVFAAIEAGRTGRYVWLVGLLVLAVMLNPIRPLSLEPARFALVLTIGLAGIASWMFVVNRAVPTQSIAQVLHPQDPK